MLHEFPRAHVTNLGGGTIGPVFLTRTQDGKVLFAEAQLFRAPFNHMVIDSPELLKMFKGPTQPVEFAVLDHPWPEFHLEPREPMKFDVARLERSKYVRSDDRLGHMVKGHPYASVMEVTPHPQPVRKKSQPAVSNETQGTRQSARMASKTTEDIQVKLPIIAFSRPSPGNYVVATALDSATAAIVQGNMFAIKEKMFHILSEDGQQTYDWVLTTGLKRQGKEGERFRNRVVDRLRELMREHGKKARELLALHNQYAENQRRLEKRWPYHLPHIDEI